MIESQTIGTSKKIRFYHDIELNEDEIRDDLSLSRDTPIDDQMILERAKTLFQYQLQDKMNVKDFHSCIVKNHPHQTMTQESELDNEAEIEL